MKCLWILTQETGKRWVEFNLLGKDWKIDLLEYDIRVEMKARGLSDELWDLAGELKYIGPVIKWIPVLQDKKILTDIWESLWEAKG